MSDGATIRAAYQVYPYTGETTKRKYSWTPEEGLSYKEVKSKGGFVVYMPSGSSIRVETEKELERLGFDKEAHNVDNDGIDMRTIAMMKTARANGSSMRTINRHLQQGLISASGGEE